MKLTLSLLLFVFIFSCSSEDETDTLAPLTGAHKVTFAGSFLGNSHVYIEKISDDEVRIIPHVETGYPSFRTKVAINSTGNFGFTIESQTTDKGVLEGKEISNAGVDGGYIVETDELFFSITLINGSTSEEITALGGGKTDVPATCFNQSKDGDETDIDCGGNCPAVCVTPIETLKESASGEMFGAIDFYDENTGLAFATSTLNKTLYKTSNGGEFWTPVNSPVSSVRDIEFISASEIFIASDEGIFYSNNGGSSWTKKLATDVASIFEIDPSHLLTTDVDNIRISSDGGVTWKIATLTPDVNGQPLGEFSFVSSSVGFTTFRNAEDGKIFFYKTTDAGQSWTQVSQPLNKPVRNLFFLNETTGFIVGEFEEILKTTNGGQSWTVAGNVGNINGAGILYIHSGKGVAAGDYIRQTTDNGTSWKPLIDDPLSASRAKGIGSTVFVSTQKSLLKINLEELED